MIASCVMTADCFTSAHHASRRHQGKGDETVWSMYTLLMILYTDHGVYAHYTITHHCIPWGV